MEGGDYVSSSSLATHFMSYCVHVGNVNWETKIEDAENILQNAVSSIPNAKVEVPPLHAKRARDAGKLHVGFGLIRVETEDDMHACIELVNGALIGSKPVTASISKQMYQQKSLRTDKPEPAAKSTDDADAEKRRQHSRKKMKNRKTRFEDEIEALLERIITNKGRQIFSFNKSVTDIVPPTACPAVDWRTVPHAADPMGGGLLSGGDTAATSRGIRKRLQVESFFHLLYALLSTNPRSSLGRTGTVRRIIDMGCGSGNLTVPLGYLLTTHLSPDVKLVGVDMKGTSISRLNARAADAGLSAAVEGVTGRIEECRVVGDESIDVLIALHACGCATDLTIAQALAAGVAFVVSPCCIGKLKFNPATGEASQSVGDGETPTENANGDAATATTAAASSGLCGVCSKCPTCSTPPPATRSTSDCFGCGSDLLLGSASATTSKREDWTEGIVVGASAIAAMVASKPLPRSTWMRSEFTPHEFAKIVKRADSDHSGNAVQQQQQNGEAKTDGPATPKGANAHASANSAANGANKQQRDSSNGASGDAATYAGDASSTTGVSANQGSHSSLPPANKRPRPDRSSSTAESVGPEDQVPPKSSTADALTPATSVVCKLLDQASPASAGAPIGQAVRASAAAANANLNASNSGFVKVLVSPADALATQNSSGAASATAIFNSNQTTGIHGMQHANNTGAYFMQSPLGSTPHHVASPLSANPLGKVTPQRTLSDREVAAELLSSTVNGGTAPSSALVGGENLTPAEMAALALRQQQVNASRCKTLVELDRCLHAVDEAGYKVGMMKLIGHGDVAKSDIIIGAPPHWNLKAFRDGAWLSKVLSRKEEGDGDATANSDSYNPEEEEGIIA